MSTRGYLGLKKNNKLKGHYNHFDSYPSGLGAYVIETLNKINKDKRIEVLNDTYDYIQLVNESDKPTQKQIEECRLAKVDDLLVSSQSYDDWYCLIRDAQGELDIYINKVIPYMINGNDFLQDPLFCEWAYIINLDTNKLEIYENGKNDLKCKLNLLDLKMEDLEKIDNYY